MIYIDAQIWLFVHMNWWYDVISPGDAVEGKRLHTIPGGRKGTEDTHTGHTDHVLCLAMSSDGKFLVSDAYHLYNVSFVLKKYLSCLPLDDKVEHLYPKGLSIEHGIFEIRVF